jgi:autoinducer 2 (AI-2) kinase
MQYLMVFDFGTGAGKCVLFDVLGNEAGKKTFQIEYSPCPWEASGGKIFHADALFYQFTRMIDPLLQEAKIKGKDVLAIATTSQREGMVFLDPSGKVIYSGPNIDMRGMSITPLLKELSNKIKDITGLGVHGMYGLARLLWFKKYKPEIFNKINKILMISDWLIYCLCGALVSERSIASSSQFFDIKNSIWAYSLLECFDIDPNILPKILPAASTAGCLSKHAAQLTGLPEGIPVFSGGGDTQSALIGMGAIEPGKLCIVAGSTTPVMMTLNKPETFSYVTTNTHVLDNLWCLEANAGQTGISLRWIVKNIGNINDASYDFLQKQAEKSPIGANGACAYLGTMIPGERVNENLGGFVFPIPWDIDNISVVDIYRASIEATIFSVRACVDYLLSQHEIPARSILLCGGQKKGRLFVQGIADVMDIPVITTKGEEATALGSAITAAVGTGIYTNFSGAIKNMVKFEDEIKSSLNRVQEYSSVYIRWREVREKLLESNMTSFPFSSGGGLH